MYNRYVPGGTGYTRVSTEDEEQKNTRQRPEGVQHVRAEQSARRPDQRGRPPFPRYFPGIEDKNAGIAGILKALKLDELDSGDILLLMIILLLFLEGDNTEIAITLGLMLLLGLGESGGKDAQNE